MSKSHRVASLMLSACLIPFLSLNSMAETNGWYHGHDLAEPQDDTAVEVWFVDHQRLYAQARATRKRTNQAPRPTSPPSPPAPLSTPNDTGAGVRVSVVDTGIFLNHPEFAGRIVATGACFGTSSACSGTAAQGNDNHGHGTHVAGIIAAADNGSGMTGVAPGASLLAVKVLDSRGGGSFSGVAEGITFATQAGSHVINMSLGGASGAPAVITPLQQAALTSVMAVAAGNSGNALSPGYPAAYATQSGIVGSMIIVGSVNGANQISSFSQTPGHGGCVTTGLNTTCFKDVFLVAPGENIRSTYLNNGYANMSGTSMATPYVSGVAARVLGAHPFLTNKQVVEIMLQSATDLGAEGTDAIYGRGLVNLASAVAPLGSMTIATSGATSGEASGSGDVAGSGISGALSVGLRNSTTAKNIMFFDGFGREYTTDLTHSIASRAVTLTDLISRPSWNSQFIFYAGDGYSVSGFRADRDQNSVLSMGFLQDNDDVLSDMVVQARLTGSTQVTFGQNASTAGRINQLDLAADGNFAGLFMSASAMNSPYLALADGGDFGAGAVQLNEEVTLSFGHVQRHQDDESAYNTYLMAEDKSLARFTKSDTHQGTSQSTIAAMSWKFSAWGTAGVNLTMADEQNSLLGSSETGALAITSEATTASVGFGALVDLGDHWTASASWSMGKTDAMPMAGGIVRQFSELESQAYGFAISKAGIFEGTDNLGFSVSRPLHFTDGTATIYASTGVTGTREIIYSQETVQLASNMPETDYEIGYTTKLSPDTSLQANFIYQQNVGGISEEDAVAGLVTLKTRW